MLPRYSVRKHLFRRKKNRGKSSFFNEIFVCPVASMEGYSIDCNLWIVRSNPAKNYKVLKEKKIAQLIVRRKS
jgi:hypothetical protein